MSPPSPSSLPSDASTNRRSGRAPSKARLVISELSSSFSTVRRWVMSDTAVTGNQCNGYGGGLTNAGFAHVERSLVSGNIAIGAIAGAFLAGFFLIPGLGFAGMIALACLLFLAGSALMERAGPGTSRGRA